MEREGGTSEGSGSSVASRDGDTPERAGIYLAALVALAVPSLIVLAIFFPANSTSSEQASDVRRTPDTGLDRGDVAPLVDETSSDDLTTEVAGAGEVQDEVTTEIGEAAAITAPDAALDDVTIAGPTETPTTEPPASSTTTSSTTTTAGPTAEPEAFAQRVDIGRIGQTTIGFRFMSAIDSDYSATVRRGDDVAAQAVGRAVANVLVNETIQGLEEGTQYTVEVTLDGPPSATSPQIVFQTSGATAETVDEQVAVLDLRIAQLDSTHFEVNYESNICANGSFVIRREGGEVVGSNAGQAAGCTTRHLGIPGVWTPPLEPDTTYVITVQVEAGGAGRGDGNVASESLTVTTAQ